MENSNAEAAWAQWRSTKFERPAIKAAFMAGYASRDAEVAKLEAFIAAIEDVEPDPIDTWDTVQFSVEQTMQIGYIIEKFHGGQYAAASWLVDDRDREVAARALEDVAKERWVEDLEPIHVGKEWVTVYYMLNERAAAIREGDTNA